MRKKLALAAAGGLAVALVAAGGTALAASSGSGGPVGSTGAITGCYTAPNKNGSSQLTLQNAGTTCPSGDSAITWNVQGPAGATGATGPQGPAGANGLNGNNGLNGANGLNGTDGTNGTSILTSATAPSGACTSGDTDVDLSNGEVYTCIASAWVDTRYGIEGPQGPAGAGATVTQLNTGDANCPDGGAAITDGSGHTAYACNGALGATGAQGPEGSGLACTTDGGAPGTVTWASTAGDNSVTLTCTALATNANCTHADGEGQNYTDCNDLAGTPGDAASYNQTMAMDAAAAFADANPSIASTPEATNDEAGCLNEDVGSSESFVMVQTSSEVYAWVYTNGNEAVAPGWVFTVPTSIWFGDDYQCLTVAIQGPAWN